MKRILCCLLLCLSLALPLSASDKGAWSYTVAHAWVAVKSLKELPNDRQLRSGVLLALKDGDYTQAEYLSKQRTTTLAVGGASAQEKSQAFLTKTSQWAHQRL